MKSFVLAFNRVFKNSSFFSICPDLCSSTSGYIILFHDRSLYVEILSNYDFLTESQLYRKRRSTLLSLPYSYCCHYPRNITTSSVRQLQTAPLEQIPHHNGRINIYMDTTSPLHECKKTLFKCHSHSGRIKPEELSVRHASR